MLSELFAKTENKRQKCLKMKRGDCKFLYSKHEMACKFMDNQSVLLVSTALEGMDDVSSVQRTEKGSAINLLLLVLP